MVGEGGGRELEHGGGEGARRKKWDSRSEKAFVQLEFLVAESVWVGVGGGELLVGFGWWDGGVRGGRERDNGVKDGGGWEKAAMEVVRK